MATRKIRSQTRGEKELTAALVQLTAVVNSLKTQVNVLVTEVTELKADHNGAMTKLDADAGVTDTNYSSLRAISAPDAAAVTLTPDTVVN